MCVVVCLSTCALIENKESERKSEKEKEKESEGEKGKEEESVCVRERECVCLHVRVRAYAGVHAQEGGCEKNRSC